MKKSIILIIVFSILFITCNNHVFDNPVDPESEDYSGVDSVDTDGDGIGSYEDVDEVAIEGPVDGTVITDTAIPILSIQLLNPEVVTAYHIQISTDSGFSSNIVLDDSTLTSNILTVPAGTLANNTTYYWRVKAFDGTKWSDEWSSSSSFSVDVDTEVPMFPSPVDGGSVGDATPVLDWEDITGATGYHIQINTASDFTGNVIAYDNTISVSAYPVATALENDGTFYWRVKIKDADDIWGDWSNTWSFNVDVTLDVPTNPNPSNGSSSIDTTPLLEWGNVTGASSYEIEISLDNDFSSILESTSGFSISQYQMETLLSDNTSYYWRVRIYDEDAIIGNWTTWTFSVNINEPANPSPFNGGTTIYTTPLLDWDNITDALNYEIEISTVSNFSSILESASSLNSSHHQITSILSNNTPYYWRVRTQNDDNVNGDWSTWNFSVDMNEPISPSPLDGSSIIDTSPLLDWGDVIGASIYEIEISTVSNFSSILETASGFTLSQYQMSTLLSDNTTYYWRVRIYNEDSVLGNWSGIWSFSIGFNPIMIPITGGTFTMGDTWDSWYGALPTHSVTVSNFSIGKYETTFAEWDVVYNWAIINGYSFSNIGQAGDDGTSGGDTMNEPVTTISWRDIIVWCNAASEYEGLTPVYTYNSSVIKDSSDTNATALDFAICDWSADGYRLPTEAEWEYAARGGNIDTNSGKYAGSDLIGDVAWYTGNSSSDTHFVGGKQSNELGLYDMSGNVLEWCWDWMGSYNTTVQTDPHGPSSGSTRVFRGGSWTHPDSYSQIAFRQNHNPDFENNNIGFRIAITE
jgi:formylglycine-generating enzyme required for sulfatase activity